LQIADYAKFIILRWLVIDQGARQLCDFPSVPQNWRKSRPAKAFDGLAGCIKLLEQ
jgi:hypothetical protein